MPLDIASGILGAMIFSRATGAAPGIPLVFISIVFALLPDLDFLIMLLVGHGTDELSHEHRDLLHNPIPYLFAGFILLFSWNISIAILFVILGLCHFLHDSIGMGWGIRWAYPFSRKYYKFFSGKDGAHGTCLVASWTPEEQKQIAAKYGDPKWLARYLHGKTFLFELLALLATLVALYLRLYPS